jgi:transposase
MFGLRDRGPAAMMASDKEVAMHVATHHALDELQTLQDHAAKPALVLKLRAVILARQGWIAPGIAAALGKSPRTIQQWVGDYNRRGLDGLRDRRTSNRRYLTAAQEQQLCEYLDAEADDPHAGVRHAGELNAYLESHFGVTYSLSGLYELLRRLGYTWLMPRPRHEKNDPQVVQDFKKKRPHWWHKSPPSTPTGASKSGFRTRPASVNRAR